MITVIDALTSTKAGGYDALTELRMTSAPNSKYILPGAIPMHPKLSKVHLSLLKLFAVLFNHQNKGYWLISVLGQCDRNVENETFQTMSYLLFNSVFRFIILLLPFYLSSMAPMLLIY